ncbi:MAG TPA: hypothetical protein ENK18_25060 [Deltaproteobacteria bacterium]|nr:hypothetical protein [Deltaproteobacteria bacterium]
MSLLVLAPALAPALAPVALAVVPDGQTDLLVDAGVMTSQLGFALGLGSSLRRGALALSYSGTFGARADAFGQAASLNPAMSWMSLGLLLDRDTDAYRVGAQLILDAAILDQAEEQCFRREGCRHNLWLHPPASPVGLSYAPAVALRIAGSGASGTPFALTLGAQPTIRFDHNGLLNPRLDLVLPISEVVSVHGYAGRYGLWVGLGYQLSPER